MNKPTVDREKCSGCGTCAALCPEVFELNLEGKSQVKPLDSYDGMPIQDAIDSCPTRAISCEE
ncbi:MAG: ferredoxin [Patescibacteria group bacterium]|jgi:ferredoxin